MARNPADIAQEILQRAKRRGIGAAEVMLEESESRSVRFQDNCLKSVNASQSLGAGLRIIHNGRVGFSSDNDLAAVDDLVDRALASAQFGPEAAFEFPAQKEGPAVQLYDAAAAELPMERAAEMMRQAIAEIHAAFPDAHCGGGIERDTGRSILCNSTGLHHEELSTGYSAGVDAFLVRGESFLWVGEGDESARFNPDLLRHARKTVEWIRLCQREVHPAGGEMPVIFTPRALESLLESLDANTNGKTVQKGASILAQQVGQKVLDERISLWDDPTVDYASGSLSVDGEGVPARRKPVFERGVLRGFLYDLQTAGLMGAASTGSGMRGYSSPPGPGGSNLRMDPGRTPYRDMLKGLKRGLLIDSALGAGQSNVLAGDFSVNVELGFLVENGEIVARVKDCMLAGNAFDAFNRVRDISAETEWHGALEAPYVCFDCLRLIGRGE